jgi:hypothetical protein
MNSIKKIALRLAVAGFLFLLVMPIIPTFVQAYDDTLPYEAKEPMNRGLAAARQQEWETAVKYFRKTQREATYSPSALFNLAMAYDKAGKYDLLAIAGYRAYLASASTRADLKPQGQKVKERITELEVKVEANIQKLIQRTNAMVTAGRPSSHFGMYDLHVSMYGKEKADRMEDSWWRAERYKYIALAQARIGDIDGAKATATDILSIDNPLLTNSIKNDVYVNIAEAQTKVGDFSGAKATASVIEGEKRESGYYMIALSQVDAKDIAGARETAATIVKSDNYKSRFYKRLSVAQAEAGDIAGARESVAKIEDKKDKSEIYEAIAKAQAEAGDIAGARESVAKIEDKKDKSEIYEAIAKAQIKAKDFVGAKTTASKIDNKNNKTNTYEAITLAQTKTKDFIGARETVLLKQDQSPSSKAYSYMGIAEAQIKAGDKIGALKTIALAKEAAARIEDKGVRKGALYLIAGLQAKAGDIPAAKTTAAGIEDKVYKDSAYRQIIEVQIKAKDIAGAKATAAVNEYKNKLWGYKAIAESQAEAGNKKDALETIAIARDIAAGIDDQKVKSVAYADIADVQQKAGDIPGALGSIALAKEAAVGIEDKENKASSYYPYIAKVQARAQDKKGALQTIESAKAIAADIEDKKKLSAYSSISEAQAEAGDIAGARETAFGIEDTYWKKIAYESIAGVQVRAKDFAGAGQTAALIRDAEKKATTYKTISEAQAKAGDIAGAKQTDRLRAQAEDEVKAQKLADKESFYWSGLFSFPERTVFPDWQAFTTSLKNKKPDEATDALIEVVRNLAESFYSIRVEEAKWKKLRSRKNL